MLRANSMKRIIASILAGMLLFGTHGILAEGLLPSFTEVAGVPMPSLGEALQCWPDSETENEDGSVTEYYTNITNDKYEKFSVYLKEQGAELTDYQMEGNVLTAEIRKDEASFFLHYDNDSGEATVTYPSGTYDERTRNAKELLTDTKDLLDEGKPREAYKKINDIPQYESYEPVASLLSENESIMAAARKEKISEFEKQGNIVTFGEYEQDNDLANGSEPIEWIVLDYDAPNHRSMLISKYGLDAFKFHYEWSGDLHITWETCSGREWLNRFFLKRAFNEEEQAAILTTEVDNSRSQGHRDWLVDDQKNTLDQVYLLSYAEAIQYFDVKEWDGDDSNITARVEPTPYAIAQGAEVSNEYKTEEGMPSGPWWLRTQAYGYNDAAFVNDHGSCGTGGFCLYTARPVLWLDLDTVEDSLKKNSSEESIADIAAEEKKAAYKRPGNIVTFGEYEQDNDLTNGPEPIEWIVLDYDAANHRSMLISKYGLDSINYDEWSTMKDILWEDCMARKWLNEYFLYSAFNEEERKAIPISEVDNSESRQWVRDKKTEVNNTQDRVFLLSLSEAMLFLNAGHGEGVNEPAAYNAFARARVAPTAYAIAHGVLASNIFQTTEGLPAGGWLLRTYAGDCQGKNINQAGVYAGLGVSENGNKGSEVARPVIWLDLDAAEEIIQRNKPEEMEEQTPEEAKVALYSRAGNIVTYGRYEQDNNLENGPEPIEWIVLKVDDTNHRTMLVSKYGLDARDFHYEWNQKLTVTWETCSLRKWLNNVFLFSAFSEEERKAIPTTDVDNSESRGLTKKQKVEVNDTQDRIFVLSELEAEIFFGASRWYSGLPVSDYDGCEKSRVAPTPYAIAQGAFISDQFQTIEGLPAGRWSLRTSDSDYRGSTTVFQTGVFNENKDSTGSGVFNVVRPVFWLDLDVIKTANQKDNQTESGIGNPEEEERKARVKPYTKPGNLVTFGHYEQDNDLSNGSEPIEWIVLTYDEDNHQALIVSKYGLDTLQFHKDYRFGQKITWEICSAREWLNSTFLESAFSEEEQKAIPASELDNSDNQNPAKGQKAEANNTQDRIFLMSKSEIGLYFNTDQYNGNAISRIAPTAYAIAQGAFVSDQFQTTEGLPVGVWLLRTSTDSYHKVMAVTESGVYSELKPNESESGGMAVVRPALWLNLNADVF